jgi:hypothetical protein
MDAAELIRKLIDVLSQINQPQQPNHAQLTVVAQPEPQNPFPENEHTNDETSGVMVPPLQQKMELLKKMAGVDSVYDQPEDELAVIKRNAGIPMMVSVASEDNDALEN